MGRLPSRIISSMLEGQNQFLQFRWKYSLIAATTLAAGAAFATNAVNSPLKILSVAAGDVNTGRCRDLGYAVNAVYALGKNFMGAV